MKSAVARACRSLRSMVTSPTLPCLRAARGPQRARNGGGGTTKRVKAGSAMVPRGDRRLPPDYCCPVDMNQWASSRRNRASTDWGCLLTLRISTREGLRLLGARGAMGHTSVCRTTSFVVWSGCSLSSSAVTALFFAKGITAYRRRRSVAVGFTRGNLY